MRNPDRHWADRPEVRSLFTPLLFAAFAFLIALLSVGCGRSADQRERTHPFADVASAGHNDQQCEADPFLKPGGGQLAIHFETSEARTAIRENLGADAAAAESRLDQLLAEFTENSKLRPFFGRDVRVTAYRSTHPEPGTDGIAMNEECGDQVRDISLGQFTSLPQFEIALEQLRLIAFQNAGLVPSEIPTVITTPTPAAPAEPGTDTGGSASSESSSATSSETSTSPGDHWLPPSVGNSTVGTGSDTGESSTGTEGSTGSEGAFIPTPTSAGAPAPSSPTPPGPTPSGPALSGLASASGAAKPRVSDLPAWNRWLMKPLKSYVRTSPFGRRLHPILKVYRTHPGIDMAAPLGREIHAANLGLVTAAGPMGICGNAVKVYHAKNTYSVYCHMSKILVRVGQVVDTGTVVGRVGSTGLSTGPHLHLGLNVNAAFVDPEPRLKAFGSAVNSGGVSAAKFVLKKSAKPAAPPAPGASNNGQPKPGPKPQPKPSATPTVAVPKSVAPPLGSEKALGKFRMSRYWLLDEARFAGLPATTALRAPNGKILAMVSAKYKKLVDIEGSGRLKNGKVVNYAGTVGGEIRYAYTSHPFGRGAGDCALIPFRTIAVDPKGPIKLGMTVRIRETIGMVLPDGTHHDGIWQARDVGSAIKGDRIDLFVGVGDQAKPLTQMGIQHLSPLTVTLVSGVPANSCHRASPH